MQERGNPEEQLGRTSVINQSAKQDVALDLFLRNMWYVAGWASEFDGAGPFGRQIIDEPIVLYRKRNGKLVAFEGRCAHRWAPLSQGRVEGDDLRCMYHGIKFGPDGRCVEVPGQDRAAKTLCVQAYPVIEKYRFAWVWLGDPGRADEALIPDLSMLEESSRRLYTGSLEYNANYFLINDNLLDLSHIAFLHEKTVGQPSVAFSEGPARPHFRGSAEAKSVDRGVRVEGWLSTSSYRTVVLPKRVPDGDLWSRTDFLVPGIFISHWQMFPEGTAEACAGQPPGSDQTPLADSMSIQAVTPVSRRKSKYFFSFGPRESDMDEVEAADVWGLAQAAFREDLQMIQAQQQLIDLHPGRRMGGIAADRGLVLFRNMMKRLAAQEA